MTDWADEVAADITLLHIDTTEDELEEAIAAALRKAYERGLRGDPGIPADALRTKYCPECDKLFMGDETQTICEPCRRAASEKR